MLLFDRVWIDIENTEMKEDDKPFIIRFIILSIFALILPLSYLACMITTEEEWNE